MENAMSRRKGKKLIIFIGIAICIVLLIFLKLKYGIYGKNDFNNLFNQSKEEILKNYGNPIEDKMLNTRSGILLFFVMGFFLYTYSGLSMLVIAIFAGIFAWVYSDLKFKEEE